LKSWAQLRNVKSRGGDAEPHAGRQEVYLTFPWLVPMNRPGDAQRAVPTQDDVEPTRAPCQMLRHEYRQWERVGKRT
jgi:hypothetical protein